MKSKKLELIKLDRTFNDTLVEKELILKRYS
jgi:hypothetical protein